jgi:hypothetical protein
MAQVPEYLAKVMACKSPADVPPAEDEVDVEGYRFTAKSDFNVQGVVAQFLADQSLDMPHPGETFMFKAEYMKNPVKGKFMGFHKSNAGMMFDVNGILHNVPLKLVAETSLVVE